MKKILITGANGFIGSYITRQLLKNPAYQVYALKRSSSNLSLLQSVCNQINWIEGDLRNLEKIENQLASMDLIVHTAGVVSYRKKDRKSLYDINHKATKDLVDLCIVYGIKEFLFLSSVSAINSGGPNLIIDENSKFAQGDQSTDYGISKHLAELEVWRAAQEGLNVAVLNPSIVIGAGIWANSSLQIFKQVWDGMPLLTPGSNGFVDVRDVAYICEQLIYKGLNGQQYVLCGTNAPYEKIIKAISKGLNKKPPSKYLSKGMIPFLVGLEKIRSFILNKRPLLTAIALQKSLESQDYNGSKVTNELGFTYRPLKESIQESCKAFIDSKSAGEEYAILDL